MPEIVPLSVLVITKNEEKRLPECLDSVRWAGELIVLDDESTDRTLDVARGYGAKILQRKMDIEGRHRNYGYSQAKYEWVLSIDADERVTPELSDEIIALLKTNPALNGYTMPRKNYMGKLWIQRGGWYPSRQLKLFRRDHFKYEESEVHPRAFLDTACGHLNGDLIHYSYRDIADFTAKQNKQTTLEVKKWFHDGRKMTARKGLWRAVDRFYRSYFGKKGKDDGMLGFIMAIFGGFYQFLSYSKYWHLKTIDSRKKAQKDTAPGASRSPEEGRATISAVILTKNESAQIRDCLDRLTWVDEIIVVDGESTDDTAEICRSYGARVVTHKFEGDFGQERNIGTSHATKDWVLQLDADDRLTEQFRKAAEQVLRQPPKHAAYKFIRSNCFLGHWMRHGGWHHYSLHFFRRGKAIYEGRVHHDLIVDGSIGVLKAPIEHHPFNSLEQFIDRQNRYTTIEAQELLDEHGPFEEKELRYEIMKKPVKLFWKMWFKKQGFREGMIGFIFSGLFSFVHFLKWSKVWEMQHAEK
jgi:glycosyltransferase involved in cell wall biosynthesis